MGKRSRKGRAREEPIEAGITEIQDGGRHVEILEEVKSSLEISLGVEEIPRGLI
jgi:hypothetical protein